MATFAFVIWIPLSVLLFATMRPARAATICYVWGWLLLPASEFKVEGFWDVDKTLIIAAGVIVGVAFCCRNPLGNLRPSFGDTLLILFAAAAGASSVTNALGGYDGASTFVNKLIYYGVAFACGRLFLRDRRDLWEAAQLVCVAAGLYALAAIWEWRMSPQIHSLLYGGFQHNFLQHKRWGFFRPVVCFPHALSLGMFFSATSLLSLWMYIHGKLRPVGSIPAGVFVILPLAGLICSMSLGPWAIFAMGLGFLILRAQTRLRGVMAIPVILVALWMGARYSGLSDGEWLVSWAKMAASAERAESLEYRVSAETLLLDHAQQRPWFGWGGWARNQVFRESGRNVFANDALWVIIVGRHGLFGVIFFYLWWTWPVFLSQRRELRPDDDPVLTTLLVLIALEALNTLFNGVMSPLMVFLAGGTTSALLSTRVEPRAGGASAQSWTQSAQSELA